MSAPHLGSHAGLDHSIAKALTRLVEASRRGGDVTQECLAVEAAIRRVLEHREAGPTDLRALSTQPPVQLPDAIGEPIPRRDVPPPREV